METQNKTIKEIKYKLGIIKISGYNLYTIWEESTQTPIKDFYAFDLGKKARKLALEELNKMNQEE
jgi:starvation-inducible outer membrane lipoprotein